MTASTRLRRTALGALTLAAGALLAAPAQAQNYPVSSSQRATAQQVAERGVPLSELTPNAPDTYTVKRGDTLWGISGLYLKRPWRWPELWGMNLKAIPNPHLIFPGQTLYLDKDGGYARLRTTPPGTVESPSEPATIRVSPRVRSDSLASNALPTLPPHLIEPFLVEPVVVDADTLLRAPRIIATTEDRVLMASGDRAYVRGDAAAPVRAEPGEPRFYRVFRDAVAMKDPDTGEILGYEAQYLGKAELVRGESYEDISNGRGGRVSEYVPATVDLSSTKEEIRAGDRLLPAPERTFTSYTPRVPPMEVHARVVSIYGSFSAAYAAQNQVVALNVGSQDGIEPGHVLSLLTGGTRIKDKTDDAKSMIRLPSERNGTAMVFRTFDRVSYALVLEIRTGVRVGDQLVNPQD
ncbi:LysM peptidoglycan-binding domain-containing protein [Acidovorax sp. M2(2025)]|uniref:LysM peptidoglycan-binding domain-containing protein n=1 Tax=Acidovorax sp. M2(2025) TaxID=3411355 RepID=UPI003BF476D3